MIRSTGERLMKLEEVVRVFAKESSLKKKTSRHGRRGHGSVREDFKKEVLETRHSRKTRVCHGKKLVNTNWINVKVYSSSESNEGVRSQRFLSRTAASVFFVVSSLVCYPRVGTATFQKRGDNVIQQNFCYVNYSRNKGVLIRERSHNGCSYNDSTVYVKIIHYILRIFYRVRR